MIPAVATMEDDWEPYYATGDLMCRLIARLDTTGEWKLQIQSGKSPEETLIQAVSKVMSTNNR